jgi:predicted nucleotidyltransferase component of viral defense system
MKSYSTAFAFRRALEDRLNAASKAEGVDLQRMRRQVAFDRLLARLFAEGNPPWRLKGGYALELKLSVARTTRDLDLGLGSGMSPGEDLLDALQTAAARDAGDFFVYAVGEPVMDLDGAPYGGSRHPVECSLDGRLFARFHLDIGMGDIQREPFEWTESRDWLGFAGIPAGRFPSISREEHFAQKLHAYTMPRGERSNTRVKDLIDLVLLIDADIMDKERLKRDIADTFQRRKTHPVPNMLESPPGFWGTVFTKLSAECGIDGDIHAQFEKVSRYFAGVVG